MANSIIILDLELSLVSNFDEKQIWFAETLGQEDLKKWISKEEYHGELVELIRGCTVILSTGREEKTSHLTKTMARIYNKFDWIPQVTSAGKQDEDPVDRAKSVLNIAYEEFGKDCKDRLIAIEGSTLARKFYHEQGIKVIKWEDTPEVKEYLKAQTNH